jgi:hypothetical protein
MLQKDNFSKVVKFSTTITQTPQIGRMCGLLETNTLRLLDPPLVLELKIDKDLSKSQIEYLVKSFTCKVTLFDFDTRLNCDYLQVGDNHQQEKPRIVQNFVGMRVTTPKILRDSENLDKPKKLFFVFPQLSVRISGKYYISCVISKNTGRDRSEIEVQHVRINTPPFDVYTAYAYPGNLGK